MMTKSLISPATKLLFLIVLLLSLSPLAHANTGAVKKNIDPNGIIVKNLPERIRPIAPQQLEIKLTANPTSVPYNGTTQLSWDSSLATQCRTSWGDKGTEGTFTTPRLTKNTTYSVTCRGKGTVKTAKVTVNVVTAPPVPELTVNLSASPMNVNYRGRSTLSWSSSHATACQGSWGPVGLSGTFATPELTTNTTYTLTCVGTGTARTASVTIQVAPPTPAPQVSVSANPSTVEFNGSSTIQWSSSNATSCSTPWNSSATQGSQSTGPLTATTTYTVTCSGPGGNASASTTVTVNPEPDPDPDPEPPPVSVTLTAEPMSVEYGGTTRLTWRTQNVTFCEADFGSVDEPNGSIDTPPLTQTTTFNIYCGTHNQQSTKTTSLLTNTNDPNQPSFQHASVTVTVGAPPPDALTVNITATPSSISYNAKTTINWSSFNANTCESSWAGSVPTSGSFLTPNLTTNTTYTITCSNSAVTRSASTLVSVAPEPPPNVVSVTFSASSYQIPFNSTATLHWTSTNATTCDIAPRHYFLPPNGSITTQKLLRQASYTIECRGDTGSRSRSLTINVDGPPPPPDQGDVTSLSSQQLNFSKLLFFSRHFGGGRYERFSHLVTLSGPRATLDFHAHSLITTASRPFSTNHYRLLVDGIERTSVIVPPGSSSASFDLDLAPISDGWHNFQIVGAADETSPVVQFYVQKGPLPINRASMPISLGSYELTHYTNGRFFHGTVPARFAPTLLPLTPRETPSFSEALRRNELVYTPIAPVRQDDVHRTNVSRDGLLNTYNTQAYFWHTVTGKYPGVPLLDGPRGHGSVVMPTHLQVGRVATYFLDPWRLGKIEADGTIKTLAGYRHKNPPSHWGESPDLELVGDWSAIPESRRGFHELWGMAWDERSLAIDPTAPPINGEHPHLTNPRAFLADSQNNRVILLTFSKNSHTEPPVVTEFLTDLSDPWDVVCKAGVLYVSERTGHRITAYDATTGQFIRTVLQGPDYSGVNHSRFVFRRVPLEVIRAQNIVGPEGIYLQDDWLYYGSLAMAQIKRVNLTTGEIQTIQSIEPDGNSAFMKIAVSDGSFGPKGTVFVVSWSVRNYGMPNAYLPDGTAWNYFDYSWWIPQPGLPFDGAGYPTAVAVGKGRLIYGSSTEGLKMISKALATDTLLDHDKYSAGYNEYIQRGFKLIYGPAGWGYFGLPLPWGVSSDIDYYLSAQGHQRP